MSRSLATAYVSHIPSDSGRHSRPPVRPAVLAALDGLIGQARSLQDLEDQGLQLLAARRWRSLGRRIPPRLIAQERAAVATSLAAPAILARIRAAYDGDLLLLKGPEVAVSYPDPALRSYADLDLLVRDPDAVQRALIAAGFRPVGHEADHLNKHHLQPLRLPPLPLMVEVHAAPNWPKGLDRPSAAELFEAGVPARCGAEGVLGLSPEHHSIVLAAHSWAHRPLANLRQLVDIAMVAADAEHVDWRHLAERWGLSDIWHTTVAALNALFAGASWPPMLKVWARHLPSVRERTVFEAHLASWMSPLWCQPLFQGLKESWAAVATDLRPSRGERWRDKVLRTRLALGDASVNASRHDAMLRERAAERV